jgi:hypothetical protein
LTPSEAAEVGASSNSLAASIQDKARATIGTRDAAQIRGAAPGGSSTCSCATGPGEWCGTICCCPAYGCVNDVGPEHCKTW